MPSPFPALNSHIRSLARRELKPVISETKKRTSEHRRSIAALKREMQQLRKALSDMKKRLPKTPSVAKIVGPAPEKARLRVDGLKAHRARLGLSAADYGKLMSVSALTVYNWEHKKSRPRRSQLASIVSVRGIGKREALERLAGK